MRSDPSVSAQALALALLAVFGATLVLALGGRRLPEAGDGDAPPDLFSAARAMRVLERIAVRPHPVESENHECVREILVEELLALGLTCREEYGRVGGVPLTNLVVEIGGYAPTGTVLCLAHYDSVPTGPGAGDDGVGVVAWIEALRALRTRGWQPRNDVVLLLSDGEELGLLGAQLFAASSPAAKAVRTVVNLEAIGNGGPAVLFELGPRNGRRVREFARAVPAPTGTSLGDAVYRRMPNDTDLTVFLARGIGGFNLALTSGSPAYHAPHDTPANLDPRSLQHMGECALGLVEHLGELDLDGLDGDRGLDGADVTFFDVLGRCFVVLPRALDVVPVLLGAGLVLVLRARARVAWRRLGRAVLGHALEVVVLGLVLAASWWLLDRVTALFTPEPGWVPGNTTSGALFFAGLVLVLTAFEVLRADGEEARALRNLAALGVWSIAAVLALFCLPGASFALAWPLACAALGALAARARERHPLVAASVLVPGLAAALVLVLPILHQLVQLFQRGPTLACFVFGTLLASGAVLFLPQLHAVRRGARWSGPALLAAGLASLLASVFVARVLGWRGGAPWP